MRVARSLWISFLATALLAAGGQEPPAQGLYRSSVVGTDFDILREGDLDAFERLEFRGSGFPEMPDKRGSASLWQEAFLFVATFRDGARILLSIDADFETEEAARAEALRITPRLGKLPSALRRGVERVVVHRGGKDTTAFSDEGLVVLYSENATRRIGTHDLEETVFHESVHAAWDRFHRESPAWLEAQRKDGRFVTDYAAKHPRREDLAESALLAFALIHHPDRIPEADAERLRAAIPARIAFVAGLLPPDEPRHHPVAPNGDRIDALVRAAQTPRTEPSEPASTCTIDLTNAGHMSDIVSNALMRGLGKPEEAVRAFLNGAETRFATGDELLVASAAAFQIEVSVLRQQVEAFRHCNCRHGDLEDPDEPGERSER